MEQGEERGRGSSDVKQTVDFGAVRQHARDLELQFQEFVQTGETCIAKVHGVGEERSTAHARWSQLRDTWQRDNAITAVGAGGCAFQHIFEPRWKSCA